MKIENWIPIFAPAPPAVVIGLQLYNEVVKAAHADWWWLAGIAAILGVVGTIGAEMLSYKEALRALAEREIGAAITALIGGIVTSGLIIWAIWRTDDSRPLVVAVVVAIVAYLIAGVRTYTDDKKSRRQGVQDNNIRQMEAQAALEKERAKIAAAQARRAKFENSGGVQLSTGQNGQTGQQATKKESDKVIRIKAYWKANPTATLRDCAAACECSPETARQWKP
jgi:MFS family permease